MTVKSDGLEEFRIQRSLALKRKREQLEGVGNKDIFCFVSNDHNGALRNIHKGIRRKLLPFNNNLLVHFDSHPDLVVSKAIVASDIYEPEKLYEALEASLSGIAEFIVPLFFAGHVDKMMWIKPPWANQIRNGCFKFFVGEEQETGKLKVSCKEPYFVDDDSFCCENELLNRKKIFLSTFEQVNNLENYFPLVASGWVLDICLDYFSVQNPFRRELLLSCEGMIEIVETLFQLTPTFRQIERFRMNKEEHGDDVESGWRSFSDEQLIKLQQTENIKFNDEMFAFLESLRYVKALENSFLLTQRKKKLAYRFGDSELFNKHINELVNLVNNLPLKDRQKAINDIFNLGPDLDLPDHETSEENILEMINNMRNILRTLPSPDVITIARSSSEDLDYTPVHQVGFIYNAVVGMLKEIYGSITIELDL